MKFQPVLILLFASSLQAQSALNSAVNPWNALKFLEGTWKANTQAGNSTGAAVSGTYTFQKDLSGHILARRSSSDTCSGPAGFDCQHHDLLYVFQEAPGQPLKAIYFDNEGHVLHYDVSTPAPRQVVFVTGASSPGPQFRLLYELKNGVMAGKFQMHTPGQTEWRSYLEWSGPKK